MADPAVVYTLSTPGGTIVFNNGNLHTSTDLYWIQVIDGLDGGVIRAPIDNRPQADGGILHDFWLGPRHVVIDGVIFIQSVPLGAACLAARNVMEEALRAALASLLRATGTLSWTPTGQGARSLTVKNDVPLDITPVENYALAQFTFGLVSASANW